MFSFIIQTSSNEAYNNSEVIRVHLSLGLMRNSNKKSRLRRITIFSSASKNDLRTQVGLLRAKCMIYVKVDQPEKSKKTKLEKKPFPRPVDLVVLPFEKKKGPGFLPTYFNLRQNSAKFKTTCLCSLKSSETCIFLQRTHQDL